MRLSHIITAIAATITLASTTPASAQSIREKPKTLLSSRLGHAELKCSTTSTGTELFFLVLPTGNTYKPAIVVHLGDSIKATQIFTLLTSELDNGTWVDFEDERGTRVLSNYRGRPCSFIATRIRGYLGTARAERFRRSSTLSLSISARLMKRPHRKSRRQNKGHYQKMIAGNYNSRYFFSLKLWHKIIPLWQQ